LSLLVVAAHSRKYDEHERIANSCVGCHMCRDRLCDSEFCGEPSVGLQMLPMALHARRIPSSLFAAACSENAERLAPRTMFVHGASSSSSDLALVYCMRLSISWLLPNDWLAAPVRWRFHCTAHLFCRTPLVGLHIFHSVAVRRERPTHCTVQSGC